VLMSTEWVLDLKNAAQAASGPILNDCVGLVHDIPNASCLQLLDSHEALKERSQQDAGSSTHRWVRGAPLSSIHILPSS
jgi:hypothetical protein